jgi:hypothetical protein
VLKYKHDSRFDQFKWFNIPGRKVYHAFVKNRFDQHGRLYSVCGQTNKYHETQLNPSVTINNKCEQCMIVIITGVRDATWKFFSGLIPVSEKSKKRKLWRAWLNE